MLFYFCLILCRKYMIKLLLKMYIQFFRQEIISQCMEYREERISKVHSLLKLIFTCVNVCTFIFNNSVFHLYKIKFLLDWGPQYLHEISCKSALYSDHVRKLVNESQGTQIFNCFAPYSIYIGIINNILKFLKTYQYKLKLNFQSHVFLKIFS